MKKPRKIYTLRVIRKETTDYSTDSYVIGEFTTTAVTIRQAWNNIRYQNKFNDFYNDYSEIIFKYEVTDIKNLDPDVCAYHVEDDFEAEKDEEISLFEEENYDDIKPLYATIDGVNYILNDMGEYSEIFD